MESHSSMWISPDDRSRESIEYVAAQLQEFARFLEDLTGERLDEQRLKETVGRSGRTMDLLAKSQRLKQGKYLRNDLTSELYEVFGTHALLGTPQIEQYAGMLCRDLEQSEPSRGITAFVDAHDPLLSGTAAGAAQFQPPVSGDCL